jgi:hypothetical protein
MIRGNMSVLLQGLPPGVLPCKASEKARGEFAGSVAQILCQTSPMGNRIVPVVWYGEIPGRLEFENQPGNGICRLFSLRQRDRESPFLTDSQRAQLITFLNSL